jgi:uncharacterized protein (TIGR00251 family)
MAEAARPMPWLRFEDSTVTLTLHLQPGAKKTGFAGLHGDALKVKIQAPPVDGKANKALLRFLAESFAVSLQQVSLLQGDTCRRKCVEINNVKHLPEILKSYIG